MSLTDIVSSTLSTLVSNIIIVVNDDIINRSSRFLSSAIDDVQNNVLFDNTTVSTITSIPQQTEIRYKYVGGVAHGFSPEKIITVLCMLIIFSIFGCLGNGLVLYVFTKKSDKVTSTIFILALAWTDFFTCLIIIPFTMVNIGLDTRLHYDLLCKSYQFLITSNVPLSAFIMVAIAVDRYFSICHPFMRVVTPRRARISIICLVLVACTLGSITACIFGVKNSTGTSSTELSSYNETFNNSLPEYVTISSPHLAQAFEDVPLSVSTSLLSDSNADNVLDHTGFAKTRLNTTAADFGYHTESGPEIKWIEDMDGMCTVNELIFSVKFTELYQKIYISFYIISLLAVFSLYFFIYRSVAERRAWRRKQKSFSHAPMTATTAANVDNCKVLKDVNCGRHEHFELAQQSSSAVASNPGNMDNGAESDSGNVTNNTTASSLSKVTTTAVPAANSRPHENGVEASAETTPADKKANRERRDFNFLANIRTAIMLFVVTLVFIINFLPAWLMATHIINFDILVFYTHFIYNVANPVIYAFMNQSFRKELKRVFQRGTHLLRGG